MDGFPRSLLFLKSNIDICCRLNAQIIKEEPFWKMIVTFVTGPIHFVSLSISLGSPVDAISQWRPILRLTALQATRQNKRYPWTSQFAVIFQQFNNISLGHLKDLCCQSSDYQRDSCHTVTSKEPHIVKTSPTNVLSPNILNIFLEQFWNKIAQNRQCLAGDFTQFSSETEPPQWHSFQPEDLYFAGIWSGSEEGLWLQNPLSVTW